MAKILIVEDNLMEGRGAASALREQGHEVQHVYTMSEARAAVKGKKWDAVLLDTTLPDCDAQEAKDELAGAGKRVVLLLPESGFDDMAASGRSVRKPLATETLFSELDGSLAEPAPAKAAAQKKAKPAAKTAAAGKKAAPKGRGKKAGTPEPKLGKKIPPLKEYRAQMERAYLEHLMQQTQGDAAAAIKIAGMSRAGYYNLLKKHGISEG